MGMVLFIAWLIVLLIYSFFIGIILTNIFIVIFLSHTILNNILYSFLVNMSCLTTNWAWNAKFFSGTLFLLVLFKSSAWAFKTKVVLTFQCNKVFWYSLTSQTNIMIFIIFTLMLLILSFTILLKFLRIIKFCLLSSFILRILILWFQIFYLLRFIALR